MAAKETTYGTSAAPVGADAILVMDDLKITAIDADQLERKNIQPYFGKKKQILTKTKVKIEFSVELAGSGTAGVAPKYGSLIQACAFLETIGEDDSITYNLKTDNADIASVTLAFHADGQKHLATGCRGNMKLSAKVGEIPMLMFEFVGIYTAPEDVALPTPTFDDQATPFYFSQQNSGDFSINGFGTACMQELEFDLKNAVVYRELVGCTKQVLITDRVGEGKVMIEAPNLSGTSSHDFFDDAITSAIGALSVTHGTAPGNTVMINANVQIGPPEYDDSDGIMMLSIPYGLIPTSAGNDELELVFT